tara:strand:+ start:1089 stop:1976 length:888 start_codon:yes stop_codon:yes gene_type:complete
MEYFCKLISECYLTNKSEINIKEIEELTSFLESTKLKGDPDFNYPTGIIELFYAPQYDDDIQDYERVFYTNSNARIIDNTRARTDNKYILAPLLSEASIKTNTGGVFKGFYKDSNTKIGKFGGTKGQALSRILAPITITPPILSDKECEYEVFCQDTSNLDIEEVDLAYYDPPYNQHPYGSNYHMLNTIATYEEPEEISEVAGIPKNWNRSNYNYKAKALNAMDTLLASSNAKIIAISYNNEGFISEQEFEDILVKYGEFEVLNKQYNTYRASRNLSSRNLYTTEYIYILKKYLS